MSVHDSVAAPSPACAPAPLRSPAGRPPVERVRLDGLQHEHLLLRCRPEPRPAAGAAPFLLVPAGSLPHLPAIEAALAATGVSHDGWRTVGGFPTLAWDLHGWGRADVGTREHALLRLELDRHQLGGYASLARVTWLDVPPGTDPGALRRRVLAACGPARRALVVHAGRSTPCLPSMPHVPEAGRVDLEAAILHAHEQRHSRRG